MTALADLDAPTIGAISALILGVISSVTVPFLSRSKTRAQAESITTRSALEVNEALREELREERRENGRLRKLIRERDERIETFERRVAQLRQDIDVLETEIVGLRESAAPSR